MQDRRRDVPDESHVDRLTVHIGRSAYRGEQPTVLTGQSDRERPVPVDEVDQFPTDLSDEDHPYHVHRLGRGDP